MRVFSSASVMMLMTVAALPEACAQPKTASAGASQTVILSSFAFEPEHLRLKAGVPVRLRLVNQSNGAHDFSAPAFFAASNFPPGSQEPPDGDIDVASHQTVEIDVIPRTPGMYRLRCTHFLHGVFGMHGTIEVIP